MHAHGWCDVEMPLLRYFTVVGGALLVLLYAADAVLPRSPTNEGAVARVDLPAIRIHSERKGPQAIVFDTNQPTSARAVAAKADVDAGAAPASVAPPASDSREAFASTAAPQPTPVATEPKKIEAKRRLGRRVGGARLDHPPMFIAQQPHFGPFGGLW